MPATASKPCSLYVLPDKPTGADLEVGYATRGAQLLACDGRRQLAVETHAAEHSLEAEWARQRAERARPWWKFW